MIEAADAAYYQETFYFNMLISMTKDQGGSRDETKNDIRALPEVLTVTLVEREKGGVQKDLGTKYLSTLKIHVRKPKDISKDVMMKRIVKMTGRLKGIAVLRYKERKPKQRKKVFRGPGSYQITELDYQNLPSRKARLRKSFNRITQRGPNDAGPYRKVTDDPDWKSAPPGAPGGLEETQLDEAMKTPADLPDDVVVAVDKSHAPRSYRAYYALHDDPATPLKAGDLDRMEAGIEVYGNIYAELGRDFPYEGRYVVTSVKALDKYGPLLYDVMMELVGKAGLKPDTESVSADAAAVWKHYHLHRDDVASQELGPAGEPLPPEEYGAVMPEEHAANPESSTHLARAYVKKDRATLEALQKAGKLVDGSEGSTPSAQAELSDLAGELGIPIMKRDMSRFDRLREDILISVGSISDDLMAFDVQPDLNQKIWNGDHEVRRGVKAALLDIVDEFLEGIDLDLDVADIIMTGSLANYNWSKFSDIDLHILVDFKEVNDNEAMVKKFFDAVRSNWNKLHDIRVKGHEVEIYVQDAHEPHISTGVYSLQNNEWLVKPKKIKPEIDHNTATKKMMSLGREIDKLSNIYDSGNYERAFEFAEYLKEKIKKMRQSGLERTGIYSPENLAFKMLRRSGDVEQLFSIYTQAYDRIYSLDQ